MDLRVFVIIYSKKLNITGLIINPLSTLQSHTGVNLSRHGFQFIKNPIGILAQLYHGILDAATADKYQPFLPVQKPGINQIPEMMVNASCLQGQFISDGFCRNLVLQGAMAEYLPYNAGGHLFQISPGPESETFTHPGDIFSQAFLPRLFQMTQDDLLRNHNRVKCLALFKYSGEKLERFLF